MARAPRSCSKCKRAVPPGQVCLACRREQDAQRDAVRYADGAALAAWRRLSTWWLHQHPWCAGYGQPCGRPATQVDHIDGCGRTDKRALDVTNLQSLCQPCHSRKTVAEDGGFGNAPR